LKSLSLWKTVLLLTLLALACFQPAIPAAQAQSVSLNVVRVYWGSDGDLQPKPGDKNVPLNVIVQNTDTSTINYLMARLKLHGTPFTSSTGALEAYAGASAILPGGTATLSFRVNIAEGAALKDYTLPLELTVLTSKYASGVDVSLSVSVPLYGEVRFSASIEPWEVSPGVKEVKLKLENFGEASASDVRITVSPVSPLTLAEGDGLYTLSSIAPSTTETLNLKLYVPSSLEGNVGTVSLSISYQDAYGSQRSESKSLSLKVSSLKEWFNVTVSPETIRPEVNTVIFTLSNQGDTDVEDVEVKLTLPQTLSLLKSDNVWKFSSVASGGEVSFETEIYASTAAVGTAAQATLTITYNAGEFTRSETKVLGFKIGEKTVSPVKIRVVDTGWGSPTSPLRVSPGDEGAPLYVTIQNLGSHTIVGVRGELKLDPPFTSTTGETEVSAAISSIQPGQTGTFQFPLDISQEAEIKTYQLQLEIEYLILNEVSSPVSYVEASPETFTVQVPLYGRPVLDVSLDKDTVNAGETVELNFIVKNVGTGDIIDLNLLLQLPVGSVTGKPPMVLVEGDNLWHFDRVDAGSQHSFKALVRTGKDAVGTYQLGLNLTYRDEWGKTYSEARSLGIYVSSRFPASQVLVSDYKLSPETVYKGEDFTLTLNVGNTGDSEAQQVAVQLSAPQGFSTLTPSTFNLGSLKPGESRTVEYKVKSSPAAEEGVIYTFTVDIGYVDELGASRTSRSFIGVPLHGTVELVTYDVSAGPAGPGVPLTLTFTLLNRGTTTATYTTLSVVPEDPFKPVEESIYVGDLDPNAPLPVSLKAMVKPDTAEGEYQLKVKVYYKDEYHEEHVKFLTFPVKVSKEVTPSSPMPGKIEKSQIPDTYLYAAIVLVVAVLAGGLAWRSRRKRRKLMEEKI